MHVSLIQFEHDVIVNRFLHFFIGCLVGNFDQISFSVRSSAVGEDGEEMSASGQMETFLGVRGVEAIATCIMKCWSSQFSPIAVNYRANYGQL